jgi:hypothetical protein
MDTDIDRDTGTQGHLLPAIVGGENFSNMIICLCQRPCVHMSLSLSMSMVLTSTDKLIYQYLRFYSSMILIFLLIYHYYIITFIIIIIININVLCFLFDMAGTSTWTRTWADLSRCFSTFFPFDIFSSWRFFHSTFCPIRHFFHSIFLQFDLLSHSTFCPIRRFVPFGVLFFDVLSFEVFYFQRLLFRHFVGEPVFQHKGMFSIKNFNQPAGYLLSRSISWARLPPR